jgi:hypothetical protein
LPKIIHLLLAGCIFFVFFGASDVFARPSICKKLERQLTSLNSKTYAQPNRYNKSLQRQIEHLQIARNQARHAGCTRGLFGFKSQKPVCVKINNIMSQMEKNTLRLQSKISVGTPYSRSTILSALDQHSCSNPNAKQVETIKSSKSSIFTVLFGRQKNKSPKSYEVASLEQMPAQSSVTVINARLNLPDLGVLSGSFTTLCVRTCDGYYFPVSFSTPSSLFVRDEKICNSLCPGAEAKLYYHKISSEEPENMIGLDQAPYTELPTAFEYRKLGVRKKAGCSCQRSQNEAQYGVGIRIINSEPAWIYQIALSLLRDYVSSFATLWQKTLYSYAIHLSPKHNIKIVGPEFLPAQSSSIDWQNQGSIVVR